MTTLLTGIKDKINNQTETSCLLRSADTFTSCLDLSLLFSCGSLLGGVRGRQGPATPAGTQDTSHLYHRSDLLAVGIQPTTSRVQKLSDL